MAAMARTRAASEASSGTRPMKVWSILIWSMGKRFNWRRLV